MLQTITKDEVSSSTEREDDEEDGAEAQISNGTGIGASTGALHPDVQGLLRSQALVPDERRRCVWIAVVMYDCQRLLIAS